MILGTTGSGRHGYIGVRKEGAESLTEQVIMPVELAVPTLELDCGNCIVSRGKGMCSAVRRAGLLSLKERGIERGVDSRPDEEIILQHRAQAPVDAALKAACRAALAPFLPAQQSVSNGAPEAY